MKIFHNKFDEAKGSSAAFRMEKRKVILAYLWALNKGDWWYTKEERPEQRRFLWVNKKTQSDKTQYNLYIGRLALSCMIGAKKSSYKEDKTFHQKG